jgi:PAS domain S-box-containing protein
VPADKLRLLLIEDSPDDELLLVRELTRAGYDLELRRVCTAEDLRALLAEPWDVAISDWSMPQLTGLEACSIVRAANPDLPFLIVSGTIDEEVAVDALKNGADDFMSKFKLTRLVPAIERARRDHEARRRQRSASKELEDQRVRIARSERLLRTVLDSVPDGVLVADRARTILAANPAARALMGLAPDETRLDAIYERWTYTLPDKITPMDTSLSPLALAMRGDIVDGVEMLAVSIDGERRHLSASARPLEDASGTTGGAIATFRDITHERATQEQLMLSDRMASVGMLAAGVAHEINNPLAAVVANLDMTIASLAEAKHLEGADLGEVREMLADARSAADRVRQIVRDLKIFSRHEEAATAPVDLQRTLESSVRMAWNEIRHRAAVEKHYAEIPRVRGSESRLGQVFLNLLVNAAQAIPEGNVRGNVIRVRTAMNALGQVVAEVSDTGTGMSPETLRSLFTPFFTTKPRGEGTGLGLAIVYRIVRDLGGDITVDSEVGRGTTVRVTLPPADDAQTTTELPVAAGPGVPRLNVIVIDDESMIVHAIKRMLGRSHDVRATTRAAEALEWVRRGDACDVIICDLMMPDMTGMDLHRELVPLGRADAILFMTGGAFTSGAREFLDEVANQRLEKPFDQAQLEAVLGAMFSHRDRKR